LSPKDYYQTLGTSKTASASEIKTAYRKLAKQYHPDMNPGDKVAEEKFKEVQEAYDILGDEKKRNQYDTMSSGGFGGFGPEGFGGFGGRPGGGAQTFSYEDLSGFGDLGDLFSSLFGGAGSRAGGPFGGRGAGFGPMKGRNSHAEIEIPFEQSISGGKTTIQIRREENCETCGGSGADPAADTTICPTCQGRGNVATSQGGFSISRPCPACLGQGRLGGRACAACGGNGATARQRSISVKIPAGIANGGKIRIAGQGEPGVQGGPAGDLILTIRVHKHGSFRREGSNIHSEETINLAQAVVGTTVKVETIDGTVNLRVPAGIQSGKKLRLKGKGVKKPKGDGRGDHIVQINVKIPESLSDSEKELFLKFAEEAKLTL
jgi:molecular chaperone DnaJ